MIMASIACNGTYSLPRRRPSTTAQSARRGGHLPVLPGSGMQMCSVDGDHANT